MIDTPKNLPTPLSSFIGREREIADVKHLLSNSRLVTLTGPGGCGKTRLAIQVASKVADAYADGVWWVELAALADETLVPQAVAQTLSVHEVPNNPLRVTLTEHLRAKQLLLVLDNCEHLIWACAQLTEQLLNACPGLKILATSREALGITGETAWTVPSLSLPDVRQPPPPFAALAQYEAVQLFVERSVAVQRTFKLTALNASAVAQVCRRLDGIPLAIELAAARVTVLQTAEIAARLDDRFSLLTAGSRSALPRHQTLRAAIDWSYDLLSEPERVLLRHLSVFVGGCTLEAAESVGSDAASPLEPLLARVDILEHLSNLVDKSLIDVDKQNDETRYHMLETIRAYAHEKLVESGEAVHVQNRQLEFFLQLAEEARAKLGGTEAIAWSQRLERENDNLRAALEWSHGSGHVEKGLRLAAVLAQYWQLRGYLREGRAWLDALLTSSSQVLPSVRAWALGADGFLSSYLNDFERATESFEKALAICRDLDDKEGIAFQLVWLGWMAEVQGDYQRARTLAERSLSLERELGDRWGAARALFCAGEVAYLRGELTEARAFLEESLALCREIGNLWAAGRRLTRLGQTVYAQGNPEEAVALIKEALVVSQQAGDYAGIAWALAGLAGVARAQGELVWALRLIGFVTAFCEKTGAALWFYDRTELERNIAIAREKLDAATFGAAWADGYALTLEQAISNALALTFAHEQAVEPGTARQQAKKEFGGLTERERAVASLIAQHESNKKIAEALVISERTVESHVASILNKLGFTSRAQVRKWAIEKGLPIRGT